MLSISNVATLLKAGFDPQTIEALNLMSENRQTEPATTQQAAPAQNTPFNNIAPNNNSITFNDNSAQTPYGAAYVKALQDLNARLASGQAPTAEQTTEEILAGIINPPSVNTNTNGGGFNA